MIVIGKAMEKEILRAIFKSRARLATSASTREIPFTASNLYTVNYLGRCQHQATERDLTTSDPVYLLHAPPSRRLGLKLSSSEQGRIC